MNTGRDGASPLSNWALAGLIALVSLAEFRVLFDSHFGHLRDLITAAWNLTLGQPHWREQQNRLLGAWLARALAGGSSASFPQAFLSLLLLLTAAKNLVCYGLVRRLTGEAWAGARGALAGSFLFLLALDRAWIFLWDPLDVMFFSLFLYGVLARRGNLFFALLFVPAILNRESGLFIALWLVLDGFTLREDGRWVFPRLADRARVLVGGALGVLGAGFVEAARRFLLVRETAVDVNPWFVAQRPFQVVINIKDMGTLFRNPGWENAMIMLPVLFFLAGVAAFVVLMLRGDDLQAKLALVGLAILASLALLGLLKESRIFCMLIPFAVFLPLYRPAPNGGSP